MPRCSSSTRLCRRHPVERRVARAAQADCRRPVDERGTTCRVAILLEDGTPLSDAAGKLQFADVTRRSGDRQLPAARRRSQPGERAAAGHVRARGLASGVRQDAVLVPQRAIARDPKGNTSAMVVGADGKVSVASGQGEQRDRRPLAGRGGARRRRPRRRRRPAEDPARRAVAATEASTADVGSAAVPLRPPGRPRPAARRRRSGRRRGDGTLLHRPARSSRGSSRSSSCSPAALSITRLPISRYPTIAPPTVTISAIYPGRLRPGRRGLGHAGHRAEHEGTRRPALHGVDQRRRTARRRSR